MPGYGHVLVMGDMNINLLMTTHNLDYNQMTTGTYNFFLIGQIKAKMWFICKAIDFKISRRWMIL